MQDAMGLAALQTSMSDETTHTHVYIYMFVYLCICMYIHTHTCMTAGCHGTRGTPNVHVRRKHGDQQSCDTCCECLCVCLYNACVCVYMHDINISRAVTHAVNACVHV